MSSPDVSLVTFNRLGRTSLELNEAAEAFVTAAAAADLPGLDLGCAFGVASLAALRAGASVIAVDVSEEHLQIVRAKAAREALHRLTTVRTRFPDQLDLLEGSLSCVLASNLFNFLSGDEIDAGLRKIARWLAPGGRLFSMSGTPFAANVAGFLPTYLARRAAGDAWPGACEDLRAYSSDPTLAELPPALHLLDPDVLSRSAVSAGLIVTEARLFRRRGTPSYIALNGRENVILHAKKPEAP